MHILLTGNTAFKLANFRAGLIQRFIEQGHRVTVLAPADGYVERLRALGCTFIPITMKRNGVGLMSEIKLLAAIFYWFRRLKPEIVFSFTIKNNIYGGVSSQLLGIPFAPNVTGLGPAFEKEGWLNRLVIFLYRIAFRRTHVVLFQNPHDMALFTELGLIPKDRVHLLPGSGVNLEKFAVRPMPERTASIRFLLVGRLLWDKGVGVYVEAAKIVRLSHPQACFQLLGPLDPDSRSAVDQGQLDKWISEGIVEYLGTKEDVAPVLEAAHCIVLPSFYHEGTPRSLLEAGAVGRPIITTDMPGCRDVVVDGKTGYLVAPNDVEQLAEACMRFLDSSAARQASLGAASRLHIAETYDEEIVIGAYREILYQIAAL